MASAQQMIKFGNMSNPFDSIERFILHKNYKVNDRWGTHKLDMADYVQYIQ